MIKDNDNIFKELDKYAENEMYDKIINTILDIPKIHWNNKLWFYLIDAYKSINDFPNALKELKEIKSKCRTNEDFANWYYINGYISYIKEQDMYALYNLKESLNYNDKYKGSIELLDEIQNDINDNFIQIDNLLEKIINMINELYKDDKEIKNIRTKQEFINLLSYPAILRKIPGVSYLMETDMYYKCNNEEDKIKTKDFIKDKFHIEYDSEFIYVLKGKYQVNKEYVDFRHFWIGEPNFDINDLDDESLVCFEIFKDFAEHFTKLIKDNGFKAFDITEQINWIRISYACDMITKTQYTKEITKLSYEAKKSFKSWKEYLISYICGAAYFAFTYSKTSVDSAIKSIKNNLAILPKLDCFSYEWPIMEVLDKEVSSMIAITSEQNTIISIEEILYRLKRSNDIKVLSDNIYEDSTIGLKVSNEIYNVQIEIIDINIPEMYKLQHFFPDVDMEKLQTAKNGYLVEMYFGNDSLKSYHDQLKIIAAIFDDLVGVLDESAEKILSGRWVKFAAKSKIKPAPRYMFTVQAISGKTGEVWIHSHGLNRCGLPELEILHSTKETYSRHYDILESMAVRLLEHDEIIKDKEPLYLAIVDDGIPLYVTMVGIKEALDYYEDTNLGNMDDRIDSHNGYTKAIFCYPNPDALDNHEIAPISLYDELMKNNPMFMISNKETERMKKLAKERLPYMLSMSNRKEACIIVKIGLEVDEEYKSDTNNFEHIWFEFNSVIDDDKFEATLTQEPYYIKDLHEGKVMFLSFDTITDWRIYINDKCISPDDVYLLNN